MTCSAQKEAQLRAQGWRKQFMTDEPRLSEAVQEYRELGFEVHLEAVDSAACSEAGGCVSCFEMPEAAARYKIIFTRKALGPCPDDDRS
ncbi:MAG: hypothetical protein C4525_09885 [Desulfarculus sp.]|jgi:hypothetical protein|nr:MAG: hypothetical protein C4525_09885 [Desulfarculus sp.]